MSTTNLPKSLAGLLFAGLLTVCSGASAQSVRVGIDQDLLRFTKLTTEGSDGAEDSTLKSTNFGLSPGILAAPSASTGLSVDFAVAGGLRAGGRLAFSVGNFQDDDDDTDDKVKLRSFSLTPQLRYLLSERGSTLFFMAGLDIARSKFEAEANNSESVALLWGPALGLGYHWFVADRASLDFQAAFHYGTGKEKDEVYSEFLDATVKTEDDINALAVILSVGVSAWP